MICPVRIQVTDTTVLRCTVNVPLRQFRVFTCIVERGVVTNVIVPRTMQVVRHDIDVVEILGDIECFHTT
ncbi:Uncharacterised protein [Vibrio cholerae]|uniref:Uncharacterized protein n=1 Tax=Vibrio cholerae TaxID=666 RepID=A0A655XTB8_VIBCL|nr:Uncharacterised protein [Vibrio cholerae]CSA61984.1 Uncharacterised protein [Vibrio cholerae]CSA69339.1 Uncharacterised protein [Vibrio cholerae]CSA71298.1 Uncharacterised protein [Vibrio cholerae]CSB40542.1 Uncharacterised protein [Vibrio cholerae]